ncbi:hypothetical protein WMF38_29905 [Sorangium sp. So ce118]
MEGREGELRQGMEAIGQQVPGGERTDAQRQETTATLDAAGAHPSIARIQAQKGWQA